MDPMDVLLQELRPLYMWLPRVTQPGETRFSLTGTRNFRRLDRIEARFSVRGVFATIPTVGLCAGGGGVADYPPQ